MWNLVKYEIKGYYKELSILAGSVIFLNLLLLTRIGVWPREVITTLSFIIMFVSIIIVFVWNVALYSRDLYGNTGYLLFSLPQKGWSILTAKLLAALAQMTAIQLLTGIFFILNLTKVKNYEMVFNVLREALNVQAVFIGIAAPIYLYVYLIIFIYFCITIGKVVVGKRRLGNFGAFVSFVIFTIITGKLDSWITNAFPQSIHINPMTPKGVLMLGQYPGGDITINFVGLLFEIAVLAVYYSATSYLLENKINL
ncbi:MAG: hypothetical protein ACM3X7_12900 [Solirubrobacterales bacterium]